MEEQVGLWWHQMLTRVAGQRGHAGVAYLEPVRDQLGLLFRALGGAPGLKVDATAALRHGARRTVIERMAGVRSKVALASVDEQALRLPDAVDAYASLELNQALLQWLSALCAVAPDAGDWVARNQAGTQILLKKYRGLAASYWRLVAAELQRRPDPARLPKDEALVERSIRQALRHPDVAVTLLPGQRPPDAAAAQPDCYQQVRRNQRDLSCLLLADLSLSTEAAISEQQRVIDVIRDSLWLFSESLAQTRDRFALYGFSSRQRHAVSMVELKRFDETFNAQIRGRIGQIRPAFYTRMGAAIRQGTALLAQEKSRERLLLLLTDGKPNDNDYYEGRYGIEDTRYALSEARKLGLRPFCVTVDQTAEDYLPHIFGKHSFTIIKRPTELPRRLAMLYAQLTR